MQPYSSTQRLLFERIPILLYQRDKINEKKKTKQKIKLLYFAFWITSSELILFPKNVHAYIPDKPGWSGALTLPIFVEEFYNNS